MNGKKATLALAVLTLLALVYGGHGNASVSAAPKLPTLLFKSGLPLLPDIIPDCSTLNVVSLTPNVSSVTNGVAFQVSATPWCGWNATSDLITNITPSHGVGPQVVKGILPANT